jgi:hypothetical protein
MIYMSTDRTDMKKERSKWSSERTNRPKGMYIACVDLEKDLVAKQRRGRRREKSSMSEVRRRVMKTGRRGRQRTEEREQDG